MPDLARPLEMRASALEGFRVRRIARLRPEEVNVNLLEFEVNSLVFISSELVDHTLAVGLLAQSCLLCH